MNDWYGQQPQRNNNSLMTVPVQGETAAQNYLVAAGNTVLLTDFNNGFLWLKSNDPQGLFQTMRTFKIKEITPKPKQDNNFIQREEFEHFQQDVIKSQLQQMIDVLTNLGGKTQDESKDSGVVKQSKTATTKVQ